MKTRFGIFGAMIAFMACIGCKHHPSSTHEASLEQELSIEESKEKFSLGKTDCSQSRDHEGNLLVYTFTDEGEVFEHLGARFGDDDLLPTNMEDLCNPELLRQLSAGNICTFRHQASATPSGRIFTIKTENPIARGTMNVGKHALSRDIVREMASKWVDECLGVSPAIVMTSEANSISLTSKDASP